MNGTPLIAAYAAGGMLFALLIWRVADAAARSIDTQIGRLPLWTLTVAAAGSAFAGAMTNCSLPGVAAAATLVAALVCAVTDVRSGYVFDRVLLVTVIPVVGFGAGTFAMRLGAAAAVGLLYALPYLASRGRGFGLGDVKLGALLGAGLGVASGLTAFVSSFVAGAIFAIIALALGRLDRKATLPFAPFIALGAMIGFAVPVRWPA